MGKGKKILITMILILLGMGLILLGWVLRSMFEGHRDMYSCKVTCPDNCPAVPVSVFAPVIGFSKYYFFLMMIGTLLIGIAVSVIK